MTASAKLDFEHVLRAHRILRAEGESFEVRYKTKGKDGARSEWPASVEALRALLENLDRPEVESVWWNFQPLVPRNGTRPGGAIKDGDVARRRWLFFEIDRAEKSDSPASFEELAATKRVFDDALGFLAARAIVPRLVGCSGNGWHAYFRLDDWPNDEASRALTKSFLEMMAARFDGELAAVDTTVYNAGRVTKILGTVPHKGAATAERPYRASGVEGGWPEAAAVSAEQIRALVEEGRAAAGLEELGPEDRTADALGVALPSGVDFEALLKERGWKYRKRVERDGSTSYAYHGLAGQPCLIQGTVHEAQRANVRQCRFVVRDGRVSHQCFDSDCQRVSGKTRRALAALGLAALFEREEKDDEPYVVEDGELCAVHWQQKGRGDAREWVRTLEPLANFDARIVRQIILDDGVARTAAHVIHGTRKNSKPLPETRVFATDFPAMGWVAREWTAYGASLRPGLGVKDKLRAGIEFLSAEAVLERVFTHTGWVKLETGWDFLHAGGALRGDAAVDLGAPNLDRYRLPSAVGDPARAMRSSLALLDLAPDSITVPLWAAMFRAPLASLLPLNFTIWLDAPTGNLKTTLAALFLSHFGEFDVNHSPANWSSTANALEHQAFLLEDLPLLIDEYVPTSARDVRDLEAKAARLIRAQGNLTGRGRMDQNLRQRQSFPPRGLLVSTGEGRPPGESLAARCIVLEPRKDTVKLDALTEAQTSAELLPRAMSGYLAWLAPRLDGLRAKLPEMQQDGRKKMFRELSHLRVPETVGSVRVGAELAVDYAVESRAVDEKEAEELRARIDAALGDTVTEHAERVREENPARRFLRVLLAALGSGQALMWHKDSDISPPRDVLGWYDDACLYLLPEVAQKTVAEFCQREGETFNTRERVVREQLKELGALERQGDCLTFVAILAGKARRVLKLWRSKAEALVDGAAFPNESPKMSRKEEK